ncbi:SRPBCC domain-containing protein [Clostridium sp. CF011]|uniref:SRPBCC domain-containing protein n=1 Tax=Clostridium sp. CF011 TaxID=2843318 RepID=UPI001C0CB101|nr:SRPBCC domain-containing protein [Clostridium sp. CF011]MBU3090555.1 SRPBCC domain-containing protein [Clostridium sp. CF011]WAG69914.1 SRPBCC domain-containing protein [Clostridium sp. CF011]
MEGFMYQIVISTSAEKVWEALIKPEYTKKYWFGRSVISKWNVGSSVSVITPEGKEEVRGEVIEYNPNKRLSYTWKKFQENTEEKITTVVFEIQEMGPLTKLTILQDINAEDAKFQQAAAGWTFILCGIKTLLETGEPLPSLPWKH